MRIREWIAASSGTAAVGVAIFALGGTPRWAQAIVAGFVAIAVLAQVWSRKVPAKLPSLVLLLGIATGLTVLQLLPFGHSIVGALNSTGETLRTDGAALVGVPAATTLTFDEPGTLCALAFFLTLLGVATVALRFSDSERGRFGCLAVVAGMCGLTAVMVGLQALLDSNELYGVYEPLHATPHVLGPLLNDNQLGCLMGLGAVVAGGLVMYRRQAPWMRVMWLSVAAGCAAVALTTQSRGAAIALGCGIVVLVAALAGQRLTKEATRGQRLSAGSLQIGVVAVCAVVAVIYASSGGVSKQLEGTSFSSFHNPRSKFAAWQSASELVEESPWTGWGRGSFEAAFTRVHPSSGLATFAYLENEYLQTVVDWGIPGAVLIGAAGIWFAMKAFRRWRGGPLAASGLAAVTIVALQSNVDFGVEFLGLAVPVTIVAATLTFVPSKQAGRRALIGARGMRFVLVLAIAAGASVLLSAATSSVQEDHDETQDLLTVTADELRSSIERHPLDYRGYLFEAIALTQDHHERRAVDMLNHALELHPTHAGIHLFLGELFREDGKLEQASIEYASALRSQVASGKTISEIVERMPTPELVAASIPPDYFRFYDVMGVLERERRYDVAIRWLGRVLDTGTDNLRTCAAMYSLSAVSKQLELIAIATEKCPQYSPTSQIKRYLAKNAYDAKDPKTALRLLADVETWDGNVIDKFEAWVTRCDSLLMLEQFDDAEVCLHKLDATGYAPKREIIERRLEAVASARAVHDGTPEALSHRAEHAPSTSPTDKPPEKKPVLAPSLEPLVLPTQGSGSGSGSP